MKRPEVIAELEKSFKFLRSSMTATTDKELAAPLDVFGQKSTRAGCGLRRPRTSTSISDS